VPSWVATVGDAGQASLWHGDGILLFRPATARESDKMKDDHKDDHWTTIARRRDLLSALSAHDRGDGCLAIIVDRALADPAVTLDEIRAIVEEAEAEAADATSRGLPS
jgi:hypothetical protein